MTSFVMIDEPSWPDSDGRPITFFPDVSNRLELNLIHEWIERNQPEGAFVETAEIPPSRRHRRHRRLSPVLRAALGRIESGATEQQAHQYAE